MCMHLVQRSKITRPTYILQGIVKSYIGLHIYRFSNSCHLRLLFLWFCQCSMHVLYKSYFSFFTFLISQKMYHVPFLAVPECCQQRAHEFEICPLSTVVKFVRRPSVCGIISFKLQLLLALGHTPRLFCFNYKLNVQVFTIFRFFSLTWDPIGTNIAKRYSLLSYKSQPKIFKRLDFLLNGPHKCNFGIFEN